MIIKLKQRKAHCSHYSFDLNYKVQFTQSISLCYDTTDSQEMTTVSIIMCKYTDLIPVLETHKSAQDPHMSASSVKLCIT